MSAPFLPESYPHVRTAALGEALATSDRPLVYGGGSNGIMGIVSGAALEAGGDVVGVIPYAMLAEGGEGERVPGNEPSSIFIKLKEEGRESVGPTRLSYTPMTELGFRWNGYERSLPHRQPQCLLTFA